ncbi:MAG TPA: hypothetical protein VG206_20700 [Terriglobia bacterium]|nr:hypothetical protein [Terriglobia bacterium]
MTRTREAFDGNPSASSALGEGRGCREVLSVALCVPVAVQVKVILIVQLIPAATEPPQLLVCEKSQLFDREIAILLRVRVALPVFVKVTG